LYPELVSKATSFGLAGVVVVGVGRLAATGRLPRNLVAGIRIPSTLRSDEAWRAGHRSAATALTTSGLGPVVVALVLAVRTPRRDGQELLLRLGVGWLLAWIAVATFQARRAARATTSEPGALAPG
jgi:hypothetical protein